MAHEEHRTTMPRTDQPLNAEPRGTLGPAVATLLLVAGVVGLFFLTVWSAGLD